ncbi:MAG: hypothetical protein KDI68_12405 [Gammaproteobacteria bacterium]|nr:hypothetical protein [Gammaproteobacteria bacterium]
MRYGPILLLLALALPARLVGGADWTWHNPHKVVPDHIEEYVWKEDSVELPEYPDKERMKEIVFGRTDTRYRFFIDPKTLRVADNDVVHYVLLLRSRSGAENLMYEGIRCQTGDYKTFAYGTRGGKFKALQNPRWKEITETSNNWFRAELKRGYFCNPHRLNAVTAESILSRIEHPGQFRLD